MSARDAEVREASDLMREDLWPRELGSVKERLGMATTTLKRLGWGERRVRSVWNAEARRLDSQEKDQLRELKRQRQIKELKHEYNQLSVRIEASKVRLSLANEALHSKRDSTEAG